MSEIFKTKTVPDVSPQLVDVVDHPVAVLARADQTLQHEAAGGVHHDWVLQRLLRLLHLPVLQELAGAAGGKDGWAHATMKEK